MDLAAVLKSAQVAELGVATLVPALTVETKTFLGQSRLMGTAESDRTERAALKEMTSRHLQLAPMALGLQWTEPSQLRPQDRHRWGKDCA